MAGPWGHCYTLPSMASAMKTALSGFLLLAGLLGAPRPAAAQVEVGCTCWCGKQLNPPCSEYACRSACGEGGSSGGYTYGQPVNIAWGGMTKRFLDSIEQCGPKPACKAFRAMFGVPIGLIWDAPVWAVKGVGYGLYYGAKGAAAVGGGIGKGFMAVGRGFSGAGRKRKEKTALLAQTPAGNCSAASVSKAFHSPRDWDACKQAVFKRQKALSKLDPANKANERWCRDNVPLSSGAQRFHWETRCNPGVAAVMVQPPLSDPLGSPSPTTSASLSASKPARRSAAAKAGGAQDPLAEPAFNESPPLASPESEPVGVGAASAGAASAGTARLVEQGLLPKSALRDPKTLRGAPAEETAAAGRGGFDAGGAMLGEAGAAPAIPSGRGASETPSRRTGSAPMDQLPRVRAADASPLARGAGSAAPIPEGPPDGFLKDVKPAALPRVQPRPEVVRGNASLVGDPERFRAHFARQTGQTCALVSIKQLLGDMGRSAGENELFWDAFAKGHIAAGFVCDDPKVSGCRGVYNPASGLCSVVDRAGNRLVVALDENDQEVYEAQFVCRVARRVGAMLPAAMGDYLAQASGRRVRNAMVPAVEALRAATGTDDVLAHALHIRDELLPKARAELVEALRAGKGVIVTMDVRALRDKPRPRGMHAVLVTAAVLGADGEPVGFYINDSATYEHGRFLTKAEFDRAWLQDDLQRVYIE